MKDKDSIRIIINQWDPMNFFPSAPDDEYSMEIDSIIRFFSSRKDISERSLSLAIQSIFFEAFDDDYFLSEKGEQAIQKVSNKILSVLTI